MQLEWLDRVIRCLQEGKRAIILEGFGADGYPLPHYESDVPREALFPWHEVARRALTDDSAVCWTYDPAWGFTFGSAEDEHAFKSSGADKDASADDPIARVRAQANAGSQVDFVPAMDVVLAALERLRAAKPARRCVILLHELDIPWQGSASPESLRRAYLKLFRLAESDWFRREGHVLLISDRSGNFPDWFIQAGTPFFRIPWAKPTFRERQEFITSISASGKSDPDDHRHERLVTEGRELLRNQHAAAVESAAKLRAWQEEALALVARTARREYEDVASRCATGDVDAAGQRSKLERELRSLHDQRGGDSAEPRPLTGEIWSALAKGDILLFTESSLADAKPKTVLSVHGKEVTLSQSNDPTQVQLHPEDRRPIRYYWHDGRVHMRRESNATGVPFTDLRAFHLSVRMQASRAAERRILDALDALKPTADQVLAAQVLESAAQARDAAIRQEEEQQRLQMREAESLVTQTQRNLTGNVFPADIRQRLDALASEAGNRAGFAPPDCGIETAARLSKGMSFRDIVSLFLTASAKFRRPGVVEIVERRQEILRSSYGHLYDVVEPTFGFDDIAGLANVKAYFRRVAANILDGNLAKVPRGCMLIGPPGTGKSALAEAFAKECGFLFVSMKNVRSKWNGESERNAQEALAVLRELAPIVLYQDEVDQEDAGRSSHQGDSGVSNRIRQMKLKFLADPSIRGRIFPISCTNRPDLVDAAVKREGRNDFRIPMLMPDEETRHEMIDVMFRRLRIGLGGDASLSWDISVAARAEFVRLTDGYSGSAIESIIHRADELTPSEGRVTVINDAALLRAAELFIPSSDSEETRTMEALAVRECNWMDYLPIKYHGEVRERMSKRTQGLAV